jgi:TRAP-type C4-dicarboxylate transport system substrate-binding protein
MKRGLFRHVICLGVVITVIGIFILPTVTCAQEKVVKLRYSNFFPPVHAISKLSEAWCKEVEKRTDGRVKIIYFAGGTLTPPMQTYDSTVKGIADIGQALLAYAPGRLPLSEVLSLPLGATSGYQATKMANEYYKKFRPKEFDDVKVMYLHCCDPGFFSTRKVISSIDDIKGLRFKTNAENVGAVRALGGAPVTMPITETYDALQKGLLDGIFLPVETLNGWRFAEVVKTTLENYGSAWAGSMFIVMNKNKWNLISKADQEAIEKINEEWIEKQGQLWNALSKEAREYAIQKGVKFVRSSREEEARTAEKMKPVLAEYVKNMKSKGLPGDEALKFCLDYIKNHP